MLGTGAHDRADDDGDEGRAGGRPAGGGGGAGPSAADPVEPAGVEAGREDPTEAVRIGDKALELADGVASRRTGAYLRELCAHLAPHAGIPEVTDFRRRAMAYSAKAR